MIQIFFSECKVTCQLLTCGNILDGLSFHNFGFGCNICVFTFLCEITFFMLSNFSSYFTNMELINGFSESEWKCKANEKHYWWRPDWNRILNKSCVYVLNDKLYHLKFPMCALIWVILQLVDVFCLLFSFLFTTVFLVWLWDR